MNQLTGETIEITDNGKTNTAKPLWNFIQQRREIDPSKCHAVENTHFITSEMLERFPHSRIYQIDIPLKHCRKIIQGFYAKFSITDSSNVASWQANNQKWWRWNSDLLGRDITNYDDLITGQMFSSYQEMIEFAEIMGNRAVQKIDFLKILDAQQCSQIVSDLLGTDLPNEALFFQQYQRWYEKNRWFIDLVNG